MSTRLAALLTLAVVVLGGGCQTVQPLYYWGNYEGTIYRSYSKPGSVSPEEGIAKLSEDVEKAAATGRAPNPGLHAQLGLYHLEVGDIDAARSAFETEKTLFPESAMLMDRMIANLQTAPTQ